MSEIKLPIYLDHHATTPLDKRVLDEMIPYFTEKFGNASSLDHPFGYDASVAVEDAREKIANAKIIINFKGEFIKFFKYFFIINSFYVMQEDQIY